MSVYSGHSGRLLLAVPVTTTEVMRLDAVDCAQLDAGVHSWHLRLQSDVRTFYLARFTRDVDRAGLADGSGVYGRQLANFPDTFSGTATAELAVSGYWHEDAHPFSGGAVWFQPHFKLREWAYAGFKLKLDGEAVDSTGEDGVTVSRTEPWRSPYDRTAISGRARVTAFEASASVRGVVGFALRLTPYELTFTYDDRL